MADSLAEGNGLGRNMRGRRKGSEEKKKGQCIIKIPQRIDERRIALLDDMVQAQLRGIIPLQTSSIANLSTSKGPGDLLRKRFLITEFLEQWLMEEVLDILGVVKGRIGGGGFRGLLLIPGLTREDAYSSSARDTYWPQSMRMAYIPLKIHSRRKSGKEICSLRTA